MISDEKFRELAREQHEREGVCEIDGDAAISRPSDTEAGGAYVQAWVWVESNQEDDE